MRKTISTLIIFLFFLSCNTTEKNIPNKEVKTNKEAVSENPKEIKSNFYVKKITESNSNNLDNNYEFPLLAGQPELIVKKINDHIILDFLDLEFDKKEKSIFENVWETEENPMGRIYDLTYNLNVLNKKVYSVLLQGESCGAYCESFETTYSYDLATGNKIELESIFTTDGKRKMLELLTNKKTKILKKEITKNKEELNITEEEKERISLITEIYQECLEEIKSMSLDYFSLQIHEKEVVFTSGRCSNHAMRAIDDLGHFVYTYRINEIKDLLNEYGRTLLTKK